MTQSQHNYIYLTNVLNFPKKTKAVFASIQFIFFSIWLTYFLVEDVSVWRIGWENRLRRNVWKKSGGGNNIAKSLCRLIYIQLCFYILVLHVTNMEEVYLLVPTIQSLKFNSAIIFLTAIAEGGLWASDWAIHNEGGGRGGGGGPWAKNQPEPVTDI